MIILRTEKRKFAWAYQCSSACSNHGRCHGWRRSDLEERGRGGPSNRLWALDHAKYVRIFAAVVTLAQVTML